MMNPCIWAALAVSLLAADDTPNDVKALNGTWKLVVGEADGKALPKSYLQEAKLVLQGERYTATLAGLGTVTGMQKLAPGTPKSIDITDDSGPNKGKTCLGIYQLDGDEFKVCFAPSGKPRPTQFTAGADSGHWIHVWKRVKE